MGFGDEKLWLERGRLDAGSPALGHQCPVGESGPALLQTRFEEITHRSILPIHVNRGRGTKKPIHEGGRFPRRPGHLDVSIPPAVFCVRGLEGLGRLYGDQQSCVTFIYAL